MFTHVERNEIGYRNTIHISHLHRYISAYETCKYTIDELINSIENALVEAEKTKKTVIVDQDGEFCFHVSPVGYITLMIPWKMFTVVRDKK